MGNMTEPFKVRNTGLQDALRSTTHVVTAFSQPNSLNE